MNTDIYAAIGVAAALLPVQTIATATATNGAAVDVRQYDGEIAAILNSAAMSAADTMDVKLQESADGSTDWQDIAGAAFTQVTDAGAAHEKIGVNTRSTRGFIRAVATTVGTTISVIVGVSMIVPAKYPS